MSTPHFDCIDIPIDKLHEDPKQPRQRCEGLQPLAANIKAFGVANPIVVKPHPAIAGEWMIILGERRWRGAKLAGLTVVPCLNREDIADKAFFLQVIDGISDYRQPWEALEKANAIKRFIDEECGGSRDTAVEKLGFGKDWFSRELALLDVSAEVWQVVEENKVTDKRMILDLNRLCKHTGKQPQDEWASISMVGKPKRDALKARMESSGAKKTREKKEKDEEKKSSTPTETNFDSSAAQPLPTSSSTAEDPTATSVAITPMPPRPVRFTRRGLDAKVRKAGQKLGIDPDKNFEELLEALLKNVVPEEEAEAVAA